MNAAEIVDDGVVSKEQEQSLPATSTTVTIPSAEEKEDTTKAEIPTGLPTAKETSTSGTQPSVKQKLPISILLSDNKTEVKVIAPFVSGQTMADGSMNRRHPSHVLSTGCTNAPSENDARAIRMLEIMNDFRTLQTHTTSLVTRPEANASDQGAYYQDGYVVLRQCNAEAQAILATHYNPGNLGLEAGSIPDTEVQKATLQRIILDASTRRFQAHKIYLRAAAGMRWVQLRKQISGTGRPANQLADAYRECDRRLRQELSEITDEKVVSDLRAADRRKGYWINEDPSLERMLSWIRRQR